MKLEIAVVETTADENGRVKVRVVGYHNMDRVEVGPEHLPWAQCVYPVTQHTGVGGAGMSATVLMPGAWVTGYFRDESNAQDFVIIGTFAGGTGGIADGAGPSMFGLGGVAPGMGTGGWGGAAIDPATGQPVYPSQPIPPGAGGKGSAFVNTAMSYVGKAVETQGNNHGPGIASFWGSVSYSTGYAARAPYCAAFVCHCIHKSGVVPEADRPKEASVSNLLAYLQSRKDICQVRHNPTSIMAGDVIFLRGHSHTGFAATTSQGNIFESVDGNTYPPSHVRPAPNGVWRKKRHVSGMRAAVTFI
jgi:hypothetical protein